MPGDMPVKLIFLLCIGGAGSGLNPVCLLRHNFNNGRGFGQAV